MKEMGIPLTRQNYIDLATNGGELEWTGEHDANLPAGLIDEEEAADRMARESRERESLQASRVAAQHASRTQALLIQQEQQRRQRAAIEEQRRFFNSLGPMGNEPAKPDPVLRRLNEIAEKLEPPEPTLHERLPDARRFKFDWQP